MSATGIDYQTFTDFHESVKANVTPEGLAEELIVPFRAWVTYALSDLQLRIPLLRDFNVIFFQKEDVEEFCNTSVFQGPQGKIAQLFAFKPGKDCERIYYRMRSQAAMDCWMERQRCMCPVTDPPSGGIYDSPYCNYVVEGDAACSLPYMTAEEDDCRFKSLDDDQRIFAINPDYTIHAAPRFPCGYILALQWQGIKKRWSDGDLVAIDLQINEAVENYVEHRYHMKMQQGQVSAYYEAYGESIRMLKFKYRDEQEEEAKRDCTAAVERQMSAFQIAYQTPRYTPDPSIATESGESIEMEVGPSITVE